MSATAEVAWSLCTFDELDVHGLYALLALRSEVFVVEQECVYLDIDNKDPLPGSRHVLGTINGVLCA